jgi:cysteate synthase
MQAAESGAIVQDDHILLNITGGGYERIREDYTLCPIEVSATVTPEESREGLIAELNKWVAHYG